MNTLCSKRRHIVLLGDFNPKIFQPAWFAANGLIRAEEQETSKVEVIAHDVCIFQTDWLRIQVLPDRFHALPLCDGRDEEMRDLVVGTFRLLCHTPVHAMGLNTAATWQVANEETWHAIGHKLAPKDGVWDKTLTKAGMLTLTIQGTRDDGMDGFVRVQIAPAPGMSNGILTEVNDHFQVAKPGAPAVGAASLLPVLDGQWSNCCRRADAIIERLLLLPE